MYSMHTDLQQCKFGLALRDPTLSLRCPLGTLHTYLLD